MKKQLVLATLFAIVATISTALFSGCAMDPDTARIVNCFLQRDSVPPTLISVTCTDDRTVRVRFSEEVSVYGHQLDGYSHRCEGTDLFVDLGFSLDAGKSTLLEGRVSDAWGNTTGFSTLVWGYNPNPAGVVINELTVNSGSSVKNPDRTEILAVSSGSMAGMTLYDGIPGDWDGRYIFPDITVKKGACVVVWWCLSLPDGVEEHPDKYIWNLCACSSTNPSSNNGVQTLTVSPAEGTSILDAVAYSNHSQTTPFGTAKVQERVKWLKQRNQWNGDGEFSVLWGVDSQGSGATVSLCRKPGVDSNCADDWVLSAKNGTTFGYENPL